MHTSPSLALGIGQPTPVFGFDDTRLAIVAMEWENLIGASYVQLFFLSMSCHAVKASVD